VKTRYDVSPWVHQFPDSRRPAHPRLRGEHTASLVVIGGGLTGCAVTYACAVAGLRPIVLEADRLALGSSGRSAGLLLPEPGPAFRDVVNGHGLRAARKMFEAWRRASLDAAALIRRLGLRAGLESHDSVTAALGGEERQLRREFEARHDASLDAHWLNTRLARQLTHLETSAAVRLDDAFSIDPYRAALGLAQAAAKRGATFFERTRVIKVRWTRKHAQLVLDGGSIRADRVIVATGTATPEYKSLRRHFKRRQRYLVLTEPVAAPIRRHIAGPDVTLRDSASPHHRIRWAPDHRLLVAGADQDEVPERLREKTFVQRTGQLMYELLTMYPVISGLMPEYGWDMTYGETADGVMYIGAHRNYPHHLFALGGGSDSLTGAFLAARILARAAADASTRDDDVFGWMR
jgi:glycine/D-amino acid oxidase-like deaminating enzyme